VCYTIKQVDFISLFFGKGFSFGKHASVRVVEDIGIGPGPIVSDPQPRKFGDFLVTAQLPDYQYSTSIVFI
jgi:hypothetical protein